MRTGQKKYPLEWWGNICSGVPETLKKANIPSSDLHAIGVSGMVPTTIIVSREGTPLRRSIQQNDARSMIEIDEFKTQVDEEDILIRTGSAITQQSIGPKLLWLAKNEPEIFREAAWVMGSYDYINFLLTGTITLGAKLGTRERLIRYPLQGLG